MRTFFSRVMARRLNVEAFSTFLLLARKCLYQKPIQLKRSLPWKKFAGKTFLYRKFFYYFAISYIGNYFLHRKSFIIFPIQEIISYIGNWVFNKYFLNRKLKNLVPRAKRAILNAVRDALMYSYCNLEISPRHEVGN